MSVFVVGADSYFKKEITEKNDLRDSTGSTRRTEMMD